MPESRRVQRVRSVEAPRRRREGRREPRLGCLFKIYMNLQVDAEEALFLGNLPDNNSNVLGNSKTCMQIKH